VTERQDVMEKKKTSNTKNKQVIHKALKKTTNTMRMKI
jgi:hypothetical protein